MSKKKIMFLGAAFSQVPAIKYAKERGYYVVTTDYLPDNPGHIFADEYYNVSTVDKEGILDLSIKLNINAICAYASDPAAPTAAFVSERMGLVGGTSKAVEILSIKHLFRDFLKSNGFNTPWYFTAMCWEELKAQYPGGKAILKPVDSSGSKGVFIVNSRDDIQLNFEICKGFSRSGIVILEQYIQRKGPQIHGEGFLQNGRVVFMLLGDQTFSDVNNLIPYSTIVPSIVHQDIMLKIHDLVESVMQKIGFITGGINVEVIRDINDDLYVLEIGARNGGNFMPQLMKHATGFDLVMANVESLMNDELLEISQNSLDPGCYYTQIILHSKKDGVFKGLNVPAIVENNILEKNIYYQPGDKINRYRSSKDVVGVIITKCSGNDDLAQLQNLLSLNEWVLTD